MTIRMVGIDGDTSTERAVERMLLETQPGDRLYLCNIYSSWDYLNDEKNEGKVFLAQFTTLCDKSLKKQAKVIGYQLDSANPQWEFVQEIQKKKVKVFYIGETAFTNVANDENFVFQLFSWVKKKVVGTMAQYLYKNVPAGSCKIVVVKNTTDDTTEEAAWNKILEDNEKEEIADDVDEQEVIDLEQLQEFKEKRKDTDSNNQKMVEVSAHTEVDPNK